MAYRSLITAAGLGTEGDEDNPPPLHNREAIAVLGLSLAPQDAGAEL